MATPGTYEVTYNVSDAAGNAAVQVVRVVDVVDFFSDDNDSIFERDINAIAAANITLGCNPPLNTEFCGDQDITRAQFAAMMSRALKLTERADDPFTDDDGLIFEADIEKIAKIGITRGCNPAEGNTKFCPGAMLTRGQAAAMFARAFDL